MPYQYIKQRAGNPGSSPRSFRAWAMALAALLRRRAGRMVPCCWMWCLWFILWSSSYRIGDVFYTVCIHCLAVKFGIAWW